MVFARSRRRRPPVGVKVPKIYLNDISVQGAYSSNLNGKFELRTEGEFAKDLYLTIAYSTGEGHIAAKVYSLDKSAVNEALPLITQAIGVPNKVFVSFSSFKASWATGIDEEMDQEIAAAWELAGE